MYSAVPTKDEADSKTRSKRIDLSNPRTSKNRNTSNVSTVFYGLLALLLFSILMAVITAVIR